MATSPIPASGSTINMLDLGFLDFYPSGDATVSVLLPDGLVSSIHNVSTYVIGDKCPLLLHACKDGPSGRSQANVEASCLAVVVSFLRHLYTGNYLTPEEECGTVSLLTHVEIYGMAQNFDVPELQVASHVNFLRDTELSCSLPYPPEGLCGAIQFIYKYLASEQQLVDTLLNYCVSSFTYHGLAVDETFRQVAFEHPEFVRDLCRTCSYRDFQDEGTCDIMRLPVCRSTPVSAASVFGIEKRTHGEFQFDEWYESELQGCKSSEESSPGDTTPTDHTVKRRKTIVEGDFTLVYRPKDGEAMPTFDDNDSGSENEDGFTVVVHPKKQDDGLVNIDLPGDETSNISKPLSTSASETTLVTEDEGKLNDYLAELKAVIDSELSNTNPFSQEDIADDKDDVCPVKIEPKDDAELVPDTLTLYSEDVSSPTFSDWSEV